MLFGVAGRGPMSGSWWPCLPFLMKCFGMVFANFHLKGLCDFVIYFGGSGYIIGKFALRGPAVWFQARPSSSGLWPQAADECGHFECSWSSIIPY